MSVRVLIDKLGPVSNSSIELKPFMVFTGESGLGKSYTALLLYNLFTALTSSRLEDFISQKNLGGTKNTILFKFKDFRNWLNTNTSAYLGYLLGNNSFICQVNYLFDVDDERTIHVECLNQHGSTGYTSCKVNNLVVAYPFGFGNINVLMSIALSGYLAQECLGVPYVHALILPPARAAFMGANNSSSPIGMYREFLSQLDDLKTPSRTQNADLQFYANYIAKLADGQLVIENGSVFLQFVNGDRIPICAAASSVKELMPFLLLLQNDKTHLYNSLLFEEPEAHVHPKKQSLVMDMLARCCNKGMYIQMTTHSDYLLSRLNQLLLLGRIKKQSQEKFEEFCSNRRINKSLYLNPEQVGAYYFKRNGASVEVELQNLDDGIPFASFEETVKEQMELTASLEEIVDHMGLSHIG